MMEQQRKFTLEGWQWRKYKTLDGRDTKIIAVVDDIIFPLVVIVENKGVKNLLLITKGGNELPSRKESKNDLFDVPDQKEPKFLYVYYNKEMTHKYVSEISYKPNETHKNRIKVYLEEGRWDE